MAKDGCRQFRIFIRKDSTINKENGHKYEAMHVSWGTTASWEPPSLSMTLRVMTTAANYSSDWFRYKVGSRHISWGTTASWEPPSLSMTLRVMTTAANYSSDWFRYKVGSRHISWGTTASWEPPSLSMTLRVMTTAANYSSDWFRYKVGSTLSREIDRVECIFLNPNFHIRRQITPNSRDLS
ncbi:hypothetical protein AVEN_45731-1 [Araneus ventricosus]|uniref:Uncharacterized protein n=1 Tax=Araneus ventricosus TaxID=182803 RepID=A0A4Y2AMW2_ARAVE|nr:hypothetical protein AVEN_116949-1 [Araneus ventricosus]GBL80907.1 hypothetical protein AVEN_215954-1 [Araneus ventricosus]GBN36579.1 hypothetical protein AVEN_229275-1 [Araneus ventricosus]GBN36600.1 hypothetical protein AVEN_45731-1 [Araneus ventricosus]